METAEQRGIVIISFRLLFASKKGTLDIVNLFIVQTSFIDCF